MKKILWFVLLIVSINSFGQNIPGYQTRQVREKLIAMSVDSGLHIPRYNGTPTGIRNGVYVADGAVAMDTTNNRLYIFSGGVWNRIVNISDTSVAFNPSLTTNLRLQKIIDSLNAAGWATSGVTAANLPLRITGSTVSADTSVAFSPSLTTNARLQKIIDSLNAVGLGSPGIDDVLAVGQSLTTDRTINGFKLTIQGTNFEAISTAGGSSHTHFKTTGVNRYQIYSTTDNFANDYALIDGINTGNIGEAVITFDLKSASNTRNQILFKDTSVVFGGIVGGIGQSNIYINDLSHNSGAGLVHLAIDTVTGSPTKWKMFLKTASGGSGSNFANTDLTFTGNRFHELDDNQLEIANQGGNQLLIDPVNRRYALGDIPASGNGRSIIINDTATVTDGYKMPAMQEATTSKVVYYNTTTGGLTYDDAPGGSVDVNFEPWYKYWLDPSGNAQPNFFQSASGAGAGVTRPASAMADGYLGGMQLATGTATSGRAFIYFGNGGGYAPIAISSSFRYNVGAKVRLEDLSDGTDTYEFYFGFGDEANTYSSVVDGVGFRYTSTDSSGAWICWSKNNSTTTEDAVGSAITEDTDYSLEVSVIGGTAYYYINSTLVATISTNIPDDDTARITAVNYTIRKLAGTNSRNAYCEWLALGKRNN